MKKIILSLLFSMIFIFQSSFIFAEDIDVIPKYFSVSS